MASRPGPMRARESARSFGPLFSFVAALSTANAGCRGTAEQAPEVGDSAVDASKPSRDVSLDAFLDATRFDAPGLDAPSLDAPGLDAPGPESGGLDARADADVAAPPSVDAGTPPPSNRGATVPYFEYEAEDAITTGVLIGPSTAFGTMAAEASQRRAVRLETTGQKVEFKVEHPTNSIVVRYAIPDAPSGGGAIATLGLYVNGVRRDLGLTSRYAWTYGDEDAQGSGADVPSAGTPHHFYDEVHAPFDEVPAGATVTLQRDVQDTAAYYVIDFVDFEEVGGPLSRPADSLSITDFGATADDGSDDGAAIQKAIDAAAAESKVLWIPKGTFELTFDAIADLDQKNLRVSGVTLRGAGMWHSVLHGFGAQFKVDGGQNQFFDFAVQGDVIYRDDSKGYNAFDGPAGTGSRLENVWIEHVKCGWWVGRGGHATVDQPLTDGLVIHGARIRNTFADGVNFANGTKNSVVEQSHLRNTGDDALATWSLQRSGEGPPCENNVFRFNTVQTVWRSTCFAIYGGKDHKIQDNICSDTSNYPGVLLATTSAFQPWPFDGTTVVERNTLTRAGGKHYGRDHGSLKFFADYNALEKPIRIAGLLIQDPVLNGVQMEGAQRISSVTFDDVHIDRYGTVGIWVTSGVSGSVQANQVVVTGPIGKGLQNDSPNTFTFQKGSGNAGW